MILYGRGIALSQGTPDGLQCAAGESFPSFRRCFRKSSRAAGWNGTSSGFRSAVTLMKYLENAWVSTACPGCGVKSMSGNHTPDKSTFPAAVFGASAERFILVGSFAH